MGFSSRVVCICVKQEGRLGYYGMLKGQRTRGRPSTMALWSLRRCQSAPLQGVGRGYKGGPTSYSKSRHMYAYGGKCVKWIGGKRAVYVSFSCGCVRLINHLRRVGLGTQPRDLGHRSITKQFRKVFEY